MLIPIVRKLQSRFILSEIDRRALSDAAGPLRVFDHRARIVSEIDVLDHVHLIERGFACRYKTLPDGGRSIVAFILPGDFCDLNASTLDATDHCIGAIGSCEVVRIPRSAMSDLARKHPVLDEALQWTGLVDEAILREWLVCMGRRPADERVAHLFCEFLVRLQAVGLATENSFEFPLTQTDIGDATGLSNVHTNRVLQELRSLGLVVVRERRVTLPDVAAIQAYAGFDPSYLRLQPRASPHSVL